MADLEFLKRYSTPTVANAIELFELRPRSQGYFRPGLSCMMPDAAPIVGYAATCVVASELPDHLGRKDNIDYWKHVQSVPGPRIAVVQDVDPVPGVGSFWGEVNANIHLALGAVGLVTNGAIRDLDEMKRLNFQALYGQLCVSHAYVHIVNCGCPVNFLGLTVKPGDLVHADQHGAHVIPTAILGDLEEAIKEMEYREKPVIEYCQQGEVDVDKLWDLVKNHMRKPGRLQRV